MAKHKDKEKEQDLSSKKKSKKHKKHKKKHSRSAQSEHEEGDIDIDVVSDEHKNPSTSSPDEGKIKLKIKFGGRTLSTAELPSDNTTLQDGEDADSELSKKELRKRAKQEKKDEDRWLEALEKGELDDTGGLKRKRDKSMMTARQKALLGEDDSKNSLMQLPMYPERTEEENEEFERKRKVRAKKRKQQMYQQIEDTKTQTVEKLLTKTQKFGKKEKEAKQTSQEDSQPHLRYVDNAHGGVTVSLTEGLEFLFKPLKAREPPITILCSVSGCSNPKKYACASSRLPVCSLKCYKLANNNQQQVII